MFRLEGANLRQAPRRVHLTGVRELCPTQSLGLQEAYPSVSYD